MSQCMYVFWRERNTKKGGKMGDDCKMRNFIYNLIPLNLFIEN